MIKRLAEVIAALDAAANEDRELESVLVALVDGNDAPCTQAFLFKGADPGGAFVMAANRGGSSSTARAWMRWPLRRLFRRMKPSRIRGLKDEAAIAIPFSYGRRRYVVIGILARHGATSQFDDFFSILESITIPDHTSSLPRSDQIPMTPMNPIIVGFRLCDDVYKRVDATLRQRGWNCARTDAFNDLWRSMQQSPPDVIVVDLEELPNGLAAVTTIHRVADSGALRILALTREPLRSGFNRAVIDRFLPHESNGYGLFKALKELARDSLLSRVARTSEVDSTVQRQVANLLTYEELANFGAVRAAKFMRGWAYCGIINEHGFMFHEQYPSGMPPVLSGLPKAFLNDVPLFDLNVGDRFLEEITDDPSERVALMSLKPHSGACVPILAPSGERFGVLIACSRLNSVGSETFESVDRLSRVVAARCVELRPRRPEIPEFQHETNWERIRDHAFALDVYRSSGCTTPWRYRVLENDGALLTLGFSDDASLYRRLSDGASLNDAASATRLASAAQREPSFAAVIDFSTQSMSYAARNFSPPMPLHQRRPSTSIATVDGITTGTASLASSEGAVVCDMQLWRWLRECSGASEELRALIDEERPYGLASIVTLGSQM